MAKIRVHELSKQLNIPTKDILGYLGDGFTSQSGLDEAQVQLVKDKIEAEKKSKSLVKKVTLIKAARRPEAEAPKPEAKPEVKEETEKKPETEKKAPEDVLKKKKTTFVFRPENAKSGIGDKLPKSPEKPEPKKPTAGPIRANVPTTAEQYKEFAKEEKAEKPETKAPEETKKPEKAETAAPQETAASPAETVQEPEKKKRTKKAAAHDAGTAVLPEKTEETVREAETSEKAEQKPEAKPEDDAAKEPEAKKPAVNIVGRIDPDQLKAAEAKKTSGTGKKIYIVDNRNRNGSGTRTGDRKPFAGKTGERTPFRGQGGKPGLKGGTGLAGPVGEKGTQKGDIRGQKSNGKPNKKNEYDRKDKKAENFKNLTKDAGRKQKAAAEEEVIRMITIPEVITIKDLADRMRLKPADLIKKLFLQGKMMTLNSELSYEEAEALAMEYEILSEKEVEVNVIEELLKEDEEDEKLMVKRPPVVCVMGHVDHGKTSLLDAIRRTNVTSREAGGITQHIGAYMVECKGQKITFLDTPGHEAFTAMRMRGAQATDIAILVVAADDGVMPQTIEAINHAKSANVDVIVAVNKIDKPGANVDRVKQELMEYGLVAEEWGGSTIFVPVSAKMGENIDQLLEMILLVTEVKELKANPNREVRGIVIEAKLDKGRGPVATVLVQKGTLKPGDFVSAGSTFGRVRAMLDADGNAMKTATPSTPVEILGLNGVPNAGEICLGHKNEKDARAYADTFIAEEKKKKLAESKHKLTRDSLFEQIKAGELKELPLVLKADVQGSVEAIKTSLEKLSNDEVTVRVIHGGVGAISESDITLASAANAIVIGFNVKPDAQAKSMAESEEVDMRLYSVIYQIIDDIDAAMKGMKAPVYEEKVLAHAEVRMTFKASGVGVIAGSYVLDGTIERGAKARIVREKEVIFDGNIASLKRFKDDVKEVREGFECGIVFEKFNDIREGDTIEVYKMVQVTGD